MSRALLFLLLLGGVARAQWLAPEAYSTALIPISPTDYVGQVAASYVRKSGDFMSGALKFNTSLRDPLILSQSTTATVGMCFNRTCTNEIVAVNSTGAMGINGFATIAGAQTVTFNKLVATTNSHPGIEITGTSGVKLAGAATASLPACNAGNEGSMQYDTTLNKWKVCNSSGIGWETLATNTSGNFAGSDAWTAYQPSTTAAAGAFGSTTALVGPYYSQSDILGSPRNIVCQFGTAGANGGGANTVTVGVYDVTAAADACTCVLSGVTCASNRSAVGRCDCLGSVMTSNHAYSLYLHGDTDCGTNPGQISCTVMVEY